jgi:hypothetical protein
MQENTAFHKLDLFPSLGERETPSLLGPLETVNLNYWTQYSRRLRPHLRTETDPVSETLRFLAFRIPEDGQSPENQ